MFKKTSKTLFLLLIFLIPTQLSLHFWPAWSYIWGLKIDYLSPTLYLTDILIFAIIFVDFLSTKYISNFVKRFYRKKINIRIFAVAIIFIGVNIVFSLSPDVTLYKWLKVFEYLLFFLFILSNRDIKFGSWFAKPLLLSLFYTVPIGLNQFINSSTSKGVLYILGERSFDISTPGIALFNFFGQEMMRAYSTFPHPNVFAGYLTLCFALFIFWNGDLSKVFRDLAFAMLLTGFTISFSKSAFIVAFLLLIISRFSKKTLFEKNLKYLSFIYIILSLFMMVFAFNINPMSYGESIVTRIELLKLSEEVFINKFLVGSGLGTFIISIKDNVFDLSFMQPVHNIYILLACEIGVLGLIAFSIIFYKAFEKAKSRVMLYSLFSILTIGLIDHYFLTLQQTQILLASFLAFAFKKNLKM